MDIPQILVIFMLVLSEIVHIVKHGEPTDTHYDGIVNFIGKAIFAAILYAGGFWN